MRIENLKYEGDRKEPRDLEDKRYDEWMQAVNEAFSISITTKEPEIEIKARRDYPIRYSTQRGQE